MSNVIIFRIGKTPEYILSANTPDYVNDSDAIVNPNVSSLSNIPIKYWKRSGDNVVEMNNQEKQVVDAGLLLDRKNSADTFSVGLIDIFTALIKVINLRLPAGNKITKQELITALKEEIK